MDVILGLAIGVIIWGAILPALSKTYLLKRKHKETLLARFLKHFT